MGLVDRPTFGRLYDVSENRCWAAAILPEDSSTRIIDGMKPVSAGAACRGVGVVTCSRQGTLTLMSHQLNVWSPGWQLSRSILQARLVWQRASDIRREVPVFYPRHARKQSVPRQALRRRPQGQAPVPS